MKTHNLKKVIPVLIIAASLCTTIGCVSKDRTTSYEVIKSGENWVEDKTVQISKDIDGKKVIEKQTVYEKIKCVGKNGETIKVSSPKACYKAGGKMIDEMMIDEQIIKKR